MSDAIISVENLSKKYVLGRKNAQGEGLRHAIHDLATAPLRWMKNRNPKPEARSQAPDLRLPTSDEFWALKDVSFEVKRGEVVGIIGRNGAGKSTLLKILSRITEPTKGRITLRGRVASLLEVGTGFHPELTGRENIFLNGAILGMSRAEIKRKFDEIVAFAEVEKFLDTPVKRYSSGMYVRLAFAVAAHLEPEILIVDEVLAVGDAEFQKKCLGKMKEVAIQEGRTVLFVSHNMAAVKSLTKKGFVLKAGNLVFSGASNEAILFYSQLTSGSERSSESANWGRGTHSKICQARLLDKDGNPTSNYTPGELFRLEIVLETDGAPCLSLDGFLLDQNSYRIAYFSECQFHGRTLPQKAGRYICHIELQPMILGAGIYQFSLLTAIVNTAWDHQVEAALEFAVIHCNPSGLSWDFKQSYGYGQIALTCVGSSRYEMVS